MNRIVLPSRIVGLFALLALVVAALAPHRAFAEDAPAITRPVTDLTGLVPAEQLPALESRLAAHQAATHVQIALLLVRSTSGEPIEDYAHRVAATWAGGRKGEDKGALVVLAIDDRRSRIEVGYGLEGALPDAKARAILDGAKPHLRSQAYGAAVGTLVDELVTATGGASEPTKSDGSTKANSSLDDPIVDAACTGVFVFYLALLATALRVYPARRKHGEPSVVDKVFGVLGALLGLAAGIRTLAILGHAAVERPRFVGPMLIAGLGGLVTALVVESFVDDEPEEQTRTRTRATSTNFLLASFLVTLVLATQVDRPLVLWFGALALAVVNPLATAFFVGLTSRSKPSDAPAPSPSPADGPWGPATPTAADELRWEHERDRPASSWNESPTFSSSSGSSWSSSDSSWSSSSSDYGGGGGSFGGGGASSDW